MKLLRRWRELPRIHTDKARHDWAITPGPGNPFSGQFTAICRYCGQRPAVADPERFLVTHARGCAGRRFRGRYRPGDECEAGNTAYRFARYLRDGVAVVREIGGRRRVVAVAVASLEPTLAGRAEAAKRAREHVDALAQRFADDVEAWRG